MFIRGNDSSLNRNIGMYQLPNIWDEISLNTPDILKLVGILWNRTSVEVVDKLSSISVDFIRSERELENMCLYGV